MMGYLDYLVYIQKWVIEIDEKFDKLDELDDDTYEIKSIKKDIKGLRSSINSMILEMLYQEGKGHV